MGVISGRYGNLISRFRSLALGSFDDVPFFSRMKGITKSPADFFADMKQGEDWLESLSEDIIMRQFDIVVDNMNERAGRSGPITTSEMYCAEHAVAIATMMSTLCAEVKTRMHFGIASKGRGCRQHFWVVIDDRILLDDSYAHGEYYGHKTLCVCRDVLSDNWLWVRK